MGLGHPSVASKTAVNFRMGSWENYGGVIHSRMRTQPSSRRLDAIPETIGGVEDHVHLLVGMKSTHCLSVFMRDLKRSASIWVMEHHEPLFGWQDGYAAFTVSHTHLDGVRKYIETQEEHHRTNSFGEEFRRLLERNGVRYDLRYLN